METFKTPNSPYYYYVYEADGRRSIYGVWLAGFAKKHDVFHKTIEAEGDLRASCLKKYADAFEFEKMPQIPGTYHPRIWRGPCSPIESLATIQDETRAIVAASLLVERLRALFRSIEPSQSNDGVFGHEVRNLLLLACMEVEASLTAVLRANCYARPGNWTMADYSKLRDALRLHEYQVRLEHRSG